MYASVSAAARPARRIRSISGPLNISIAMPKKCRERVEVSNTVWISLSRTSRFYVFRPFRES
jgi:hypothetical protein